MSTLAALDPSQAGGPEGAALFSPPGQQQIQQQQIVREDPSASAPMPPELRRQMAATAKAAEPGELPPELQAYIESGLIAPAFPARQSGLGRVRPNPTFSTGAQNWLFSSIFSRKSESIQMPLR